MADLTTIPLKTIAGEPTSLGAFAGKVVLAVNVASQCGLTPQYEGLEQLYRDYREQGLVVAGFPSNDFGGQEPGGASDIAHTAHQGYGVTFPLAAKADVRGANPHPFYKWAAAERPLDTPRWNFHKYLVGHEGHIVAAFPSTVEPTDARIVTAIEKELSSSAA